MHSHVTGMHACGYSRQYGSPQHTASRYTMSYKAHWSSRHNNIDSLKTCLYHHNMYIFFGARLTITESIVELSREHTYIIITIHPFTSCLHQREQKVYEHATGIYI